MTQYSKEFKTAFKGLCKQFDVIDLARLLKISAQEVRKIKKELGIL